MPHATDSEALLVEAAEANAPAVAEQLASDGAPAQGYIEFGIPWESGVIRDETDLDEMRAWRASPGGDGATRVMMDVTTLVTLQTLLSGDPGALTPLTLWDLGRAVSAIICFDEICHFPTSAVTDDALNAKLGEVVFRSLPAPTASEGRDDQRGLPGFIDWSWATTDQLMRSLEARIGAPDEYGAQVDELRAQWSAVLGMDLSAKEVINTEAASFRWNSPGPALLAQLVRASSTTPRDFDTLQGTFGQDVLPAEIVVKRREAYCELICEANYRGFATQRSADALGLPYLPGIVRMPFRHRFYDQAKRINDRLLSIEMADARYAERVRASQAVGAPVVLPVFLAVALRRAGSREDLWSAIADLRHAARKFRGRRLSLEQALVDGDEAIVAALGDALRTDARQLSKSLIEGAAAGGSDLLSSAQTIEPAQCASLLPANLIGIGISAVIAASKALLPESTRKRLFWRLAKPQYRFLSDVSSESRSITRSLPRVQRLWNLPDGGLQEFSDRYEAFGALGHSPLG